MRYIIAALFCLFATLAQAQAPTRLCFSPVNGDINRCQPVDTGNPLPVTATVSVAGFTPGLSFATLTATGSSASVALPTGTVVLFQNTGTTAVSCTLGIGSATATTNENIIQASSSFPMTVGSNTFGACIDQTGSASNLVVLSGGSGLANASGGGGSTGGLSVTDQAAWTQAASSFTPSGGVFNDTSTLSSGQQGTFRLTTKRAQIVDVDSSGSQLHTDLTSAIPDCGSTPCTNRIGEVYPLTATSTQAKVTITIGTTYQQYLASNTSRKGCTIQFITAAHTGFVFFGAAPADTTTSFQLSPGQTISCTNGNGTVLTDAIQLTSSNNSDVFVVNSF